MTPPVADLSAGFQAERAARDTLLAFVQRGQTPQAAAHESSHYRPAADHWLALLQQLHEQQAASAQAALAENERLARFSLLLTLGLCAAAVVVGLWWSRTVSRSIASPIGQAVVLSESIASGDLLNDVARSADPADGGETGQLMNSLERMRLALLEVSSDTRNGADAVSRASAQMAMSAQSLAIRTETQTQDIDTLRSALSQVSHHIQATARRADGGADRCQELAAQARRGAAAAERTVADMRRMAERSQRIESVVALIESIGMQTTLLSLNASIEAARAGALGAGFGVVAAEVRTLAQRTAASAQQIRQMAEAGAQDSEAGVEHVNELSALLAAVAQRVDAVSAESQSIASDERRDDRAISGVNQSLQELGQTNQANIEIVESTVHGCESLRVEAERLAVTVRRLNTGDLSGPATDRVAGAVSPPDAVDYFV